MYNAHWIHSLPYSKFIELTLKNGRFEKHFLPYLNKKRCFTNHPGGIFNKFKISNRTIHITNHLPHLHEQEKKSKNTNDCFLL